MNVFASPARLLLPFLSVSPLALVIACSGAPAPESSTTNAALENASSGDAGAGTGAAVSSKILLSCDHGAADLSVSQASDRDVSFTIHDANIVSYLGSKALHLGSPDIVAEASYSGAALDSASDFESFTSDPFTETANWNETVWTRVVADVARDPNGGPKRVKVTLMKEVQTETCSGYIDDHQCVNGTWSSQTTREELANWDFQDCE